MRKPDSSPIEEHQLIRSITADLIEIFPDAPEFWTGMEDLKEFKGGLDRVPVFYLWKMYAARLGGNISDSPFETTPPTMMKRREKKESDK